MTRFNTKAHRKATIELTIDEVEQLWLANDFFRWQRMRNAHPSWIDLANNLDKRLIAAMDYCSKNQEAE